MAKTNKLDNLLQYLRDVESETDSVSGSIRNAWPSERVHGNERSEREERDDSTIETVTSSLPPYPGLTNSTRLRRSNSASSRSRYADEEMDQLSGMPQISQQISDLSFQPSTGASSQRSFIWDEVNEPGMSADAGAGEVMRPPSSFSSFSVAHSGRERGGSSWAGSSVASSDASFISNDSQYENMENQAEAMKAELKERRTKVKALQAELEELKKSITEYQQRSASKWQQEIATQRQTAAVTIARHTEFRAGLDKDIQTLSERLEELESKLSKIVRSRDAEYELTNQQCTKDLKNARETWLDAEKRRLSRMAEKKEAEMKAQAVRELEPELHNLISGNKKKLAAQREENQLSLREEKLKLDKDMQQALIDALKMYESELQEETENLRKEGQQRKRDTMADNEVAAQKLKKEYNAELESERVRFEAERKRRRDYIASEESIARQKQQDQVQQLIKQHQLDTLGISQRYTQELEKEMRRLDIETESWKQGQLDEIHKDVSRKKQTNMEAMKSKRDVELNMVIQRLQEESDAEVTAYETELQDAFEKLSNNKRQKLEKKQLEERAAYESYIQKHDLQASVLSACKILRESLTKIQEECAVLKTEIEDLRCSQTKQANATESRVMQLGSEGESERSRLLDECKEASARLDIVLKDLKHTMPTLIEQEHNLRDKNEAESAKVNGKIELLLAKKENIIQQLHSNFQELYNENMQLASKIDSQRALRIESG